MKHSKSVPLNWFQSSLITENLYLRTIFVFIHVNAFSNFKVYHSIITCFTFNCPCWIPYFFVTCLLMYCRFNVNVYRMVKDLNRYPIEMWWMCVFFWGETYVETKNDFKAMWKKWFFERNNNGKHIPIWIWCFNKQ